MITWNVSPILLSLGPIQLRWYGLLFALGFVLGLRVMEWAFRRDGLSTKHLDTLLIYVVLGTVIGARLGHCLVYEPEIYLNDPIRILKIWEGGLASHFGGLGVIIALIIWQRKYFPQKGIIALLDYLCLSTALTGGLIRLGNLFNSEIIGKPTEAGWGFVFPRVDRVPIPRHPTQLYESFAYFLTFFVLFFMVKQKKHRGRPGLIFGLFFIMIFTARFLIEFFKEPQVNFERGMAFDLGQLLSIPFILAGVFLVVRALRMSREPNADTRR
jgi:phosphatidylglycerol:prolipoprotein diacylglycerol transferase